MLAAVLALAVAVQEVQVRVGASGEKSRADSVRRAALRDSIRMEELERSIDRHRRPPRRVPLTPELERTAFRDAGARTLLLRAREARLRQDSSLLSYDAQAYQRISVGLGIRAVGRNRLLFRSENASRVRWSRTGGLHIDLKGARTALPLLSQGERKEAEKDPDFVEVNTGGTSPVPYYPGREALWIGSGTARAEVDERELIHPIALGSEAYYRYATGDSLTITLSEGKVIRLRELRVEPRRPEWKLSVGSFWFDDATGQLVRAVYRLAAPMNIWAVAEEEARADAAEDRARGRGGDDDDAPPGWVKAMMSPMQANLEAVTIEYGLFGGRFWLPRSQYMEGWARASFVRVPVRMEESFRYASVNGGDSLPPLPLLQTRRELRDSLFGGDTTSWEDLPDSVRRERRRMLAQADSARRAREREQRRADCAASGHYTRVGSRYDGALRTAVRIPCDTAVLSRSPDLPGSIFDPGEEIFGSADRGELLAALDFSHQPEWAPQPVRLAYGLDLVRYNRVEGFSAAVQGSQELGMGLTWDATARLGTGEWRPNAELGVARSNGRHRWRGGAYHRLAVANDDWGSPLSFGASLGALLHGRDEGYYFRATGAELTRTLARGGGFAARLFVERQREAKGDAEFNLSRALGGGSRFAPNIAAEPVTVAALALRNQLSRGLDPMGWRLFADVRAEGGWVAPADSAAGRGYARLSGDATLSRGLGSQLAAAVTVGGGVSERAPLQRAFFLGGSQTVRGQLLGAAAGEAYWLGRMELGRATGVVRPVVFGDIGWAGARADWKSPGRPLSGAGVGASILDGLVRVDLSRGIWPRQKMRLDLYVEGRF